MRTRLLVAVGLVGSALVSAPASAASNPCASAAAAQRYARSAGLVDVIGTSGDDQLTGTELPDVIYGGAGHDVIRGLGGDDILCGDSGRDGINGGLGNDLIGGGADADFLVGHDGNDSIWGMGGTDALYGSAGADSLYGNDDAERDYLAGGSSTDTMTPGSGDDSYQDRQPDGGCPSLGYGRWQGTYGTDNRLPLHTSGNPCLTVTGSITNYNASGDGDLHFKVNGLVIELMPRDKGAFSGLGLKNGDVVTVQGLHVRDAGHSLHPEIHPVYRVTKGSTTRYSGPQNGGSPFRLRPNVVQIGQPDRRYCWTEGGATCSPWDPAGEPFYLNLLAATEQLLHAHERVAYA